MHLDLRPVAVAQPGHTCVRAPAPPHLGVVGLRVRIDRDVRNAQAEQFRPGVAQELAGVGVDGEVAAVVVGDEDRHWTMLERLSDKALLDELVRDG